MHKAEVAVVAEAGAVEAAGAGEPVAVISSVGRHWGPYNVNCSTPQVIHDQNYILLML